MPRLFDGGTVACLATGPSLNRADVDYLRGHVDGVIAINDAHRLCPWADILYSSDRRWYAHYKGVPTFQGRKYSIGSGLGKRNPYPRFLEITVLKNTGYVGLDTDPRGLRTGRNSGFAAVNLAVHTGASRILLLGYNLSTPGHQVHFFGNHPSGLNQNTGLYPGWRRIFETLVEPLKTLGVDVINCTEQSSLDVFPQAALRDVLQAPVERVA